MIPAKPVVVVVVLALYSALLGTSCATTTVHLPQSSSPRWEYEIAIEFWPGGWPGLSSKPWRGQVDQAGIADLDVLVDGEWTQLSISRLSDAQLDEVAATIDQSDFWQIRERLGIPLVTHYPSLTVGVSRGSDRHQVTEYAVDLFRDELVDKAGQRRLHRVLDSIVRSIPSLNGSHIIEW